MRGTPRPPAMRSHPRLIEGYPHRARPPWEHAEESDHPAKDGLNWPYSPTKRPLDGHRPGTHVRARQPRGEWAAPSSAARAARGRVPPVGNLQPPRACAEAGDQPGSEDHPVQRDFWNHGPTDLDAAEGLVVSAGHPGSAQEPTPDRDRWRPSLSDRLGGQRLDTTRPPSLLAASPPRTASSGAATAGGYVQSGSLVLSY